MVGAMRQSAGLTGCWISLPLGHCAFSPNPNPGLDVKESTVLLFAGNFVSCKMLKIFSLLNELMPRVKFLTKSGE